MLTTSASQIAEATRGRLEAGPADVTVSGVVIDSRDVESGSAFIAMPGEHVDGHDFLGVAITNGARLLVVTKPLGELGSVAEEAARGRVAIVRVSDALRAVQDLATWYRGRLRCPVIGITGSTGKTTTKDFLNAALATTMSVVSTQENRNNELGVPLTVLSAGPGCDVLVVEMGMRGLGQIARLCEIARPTLGLVTNVGQTHIEVVGSQQAITQSKGELVAAIPDNGTVFLNGDDRGSEPLTLRAVAPVITYGLGEECDVRAENIETDADSRASFDLVGSGIEPARIELPLPGRHNVYNALAAAAVALRVGVPSVRIAEGIAASHVSAMRMEVFEAASGVTVVNDAYNANPTSMRAAVETLSAMDVGGKRVAVLGDMAELGSLTELAHFRVGEQVARSRIAELVTVGERGARIAAGASAEGMAPGSIHVCVTAEDAVEVLEDLLREGDAVLVKASRVMGLEAVVDGIVSPRV